MLFFWSLKKTFSTFFRLLKISSKKYSEAPKDGRGVPLTGWTRGLENFGPKFPSFGDFPANHAILRNVVSNFETFSHIPCPNVFGESFYSKDIPKNNFVEKNPSHQEEQPPQGRGTEGRWEDRTLGRWTTGARGRLDF